MAELGIPELKERIPSIVEPMNFFKRRSEDFSDGSDKNWDLLRRLGHADFNLENHFTHGSAGYFVEAVEEFNFLRDDLLDLSVRYPNVSDAIRNYLPRLREFADRDSRFIETYESYRDTFGGETQ